jgi:alpha-glucosidase
VRARAGLLAILGLPGGAYIYQGQELNLPEVDVPLEARVDPMWTRGGVSRDGARVPMPWTVAPDNTFGFSANGAATPWLPVPAMWGSRSVEAHQNDSGSILHLVTTALELRKQLIDKEVLLSDDGGRWRIEEAGLLICERNDQFLVAIAMGEGPVSLPDGDVVVSSSPMTTEGLLPPDAAAWLLRR